MKQSHASAAVEVKAVCAAASVAACVAAMAVALVVTAATWVVAWLEEAARSTSPTFVSLGLVAGDFANSISSSLTQSAGKISRIFSVKLVS